MEADEKYKRRPFMMIPVAEAYFPASSIEQARAAMFRCLNRGEGIAVVFGGTGLGKTLLLRVLAEDFQRNDLVILAHSCPRSVKAFYQQLLLGFHQTWCGCDENECRLFTIDFLQKNTDQKVVLLIDEAQRLTLPVMEELRVLLDLCNNDQVRFCTAMAGTSRLEEHLTSPRLVALSQRIVCRAWLDPFTGPETAQYIDCALSQAGMPLQNVQFENEAKRLIHRLSEGVPRVVNQLCDALVYSLFSDKQTKTYQAGEGGTVGQNDYFTVCEKDVAQAWGTLQQVSPDSIALSGHSGSKPVANTSIPQVDSSEAVVEFGSLSDEDDEPAESCKQIQSGEKSDWSGSISLNSTSPDSTSPGSTPDEIYESVEETNSSVNRVNPGKNEMNDRSEQKNSQADDPCDQETVEPQSDTDLTYDRMIRERLLGDTSESLPERNDSEDERNVSESTQKQFLQPADEDFSESALTDTPDHEDLFDHCDETFEVQLNGSQTEYRCDSSHTQEDENLLAAADEYLDELLSLEGEVGLEAEVVRQIRDIHQHLRRTRQTSGELSDRERNSLTKLDYSVGKSEDQNEHRGRLAKNS
ncbi:MAG: AAA family ATPase, partial [Thermoguttaceae bacterium]|nr:AAA family ATPase [Thermoguttaceae bacterium]